MSFFVPLHIEMENGLLKISVCVLYISHTKQPRCQRRIGFISSVHPAICSSHAAYTGLTALAQAQCGIFARCLPGLGAVIYRVGSMARYEALHKDTDPTTVSVCVYAQSCVPLIK